MKSYFSDIQFFTGAVPGRNCIPLLGTFRTCDLGRSAQIPHLHFLGGRLEAMARPWQARAMGFCMGTQAHLIVMGSEGLIDVMADRDVKRRKTSCRSIT